MPSASKLRLVNDSAAKANDWWSWSVWVEGPDEELDRIEKVVYTLHPTFPNPVRTTTDRASKYRLSSEGWGEFSVSAQVFLADGAVIKLRRWIQFGAEPATPAAGRRPGVFLSYGISERRFAAGLIASLKDQGIDVLTHDSAGADLPLDTMPEEVTRRVDLVVVLVAREPRPLALLCADRAAALRKPVMTVLLDDVDRSLLPPPLLHMHVSSSGKGSDVQAVADAIVSRAKDAYHKEDVLEPS
jgi:hypothetical protein